MLCIHQNTLNSNACVDHALDLFTQRLPKAAEETVYTALLNWPNNVSLCVQGEADGTASFHVFGEGGFRILSIEVDDCEGIVTVDIREAKPYEYELPNKGKDRP